MVSLKFLKRFKMYSLNNIHINISLKYLIKSIYCSGLCTMNIANLLVLK